MMRRISPFRVAALGLLAGLSVVGAQQLRALDSDKKTDKTSDSKDAAAPAAQADSTTEGTVTVDGRRSLIKRWPER